MKRGRRVILLERKWKLPEKSEGEGSLSDRLLRSRGIEDQDRKDFFSDLPDNFSDPFLMNDMDAAVTRILSALENKESILICGDYDCDGITSTAILMDFFRKAGANVQYLLPSRFKEGYGLSDKMLTRVLEKHPDLLITVDCGISNAEQVEELMESGLDVIVTDHHECPEELPPALAVIDCKRRDNTYPFSELCGAGVALKLVAALCSRMNGKVPLDAWKSYSDIAAIGTIADVVTLTGENRTIVKYGLQMLKVRRRPGLAALFEVAWKNQSSSNPIDATGISFQITPRINACGRLGDPSRAVELLLCYDPETAGKIALELDQQNTQRKEIEARIVNEAVTQIQSDPRLIQDMKIPSMPIVLVGDNWHPGVIGIVANRLVDRFQHSAIVLTRLPEDKGVLRGSCRSAGDYPIFSALCACEEVLGKFGGHARAAGLDLPEENLSSFIQKLRDFSETHGTDMDTNYIKIDAEVKKEDLTLSSAKEISKLAPFGEGNREPLFLLRNQFIAGGNFFGKEKNHLKISLISEEEVEAAKRQYADDPEEDPPIGRKLPDMTEVILYSQGDRSPMFLRGRKIDVVLRMNVNTWNQTEKVELLLVDFHYSPIGKNIWDKPEALESLYRNKLPIKQVAMVGKCTTDELCPKMEEVFAVYDFIKTRCQEGTSVCDLSLMARFLSGVEKKSIHAFKLSRILDMLNEAGQIHLERFSDTRVWFTLREGFSEGKLKETATYRALLSP